MSRCVQIVGHTNYTSGFLKTCKRTNDIVGNITDFDESSLMTLWVYIDANNNRWEEFIQYQPWSSGPMYFLCLNNTLTRMSIHHEVKT